jgi:hypothetical protein
MVMVYPETGMSPGFCSAMVVVYPESGRGCALC